MAIDRSLLWMGVILVWQSQLEGGYRGGKGKERNENLSNIDIRVLGSVAPSVPATMLVPGGKGGKGCRRDDKRRGNEGESFWVEEGVEGVEGDREGRNPPVMLSCL